MDEYMVTFKLKLQLNSFGFDILALFRLLSFKMLNLPVGARLLDHIANQFTAILKYMDFWKFTFRSPVALDVHQHGISIVSNGVFVFVQIGHLTIRTHQKEQQAVRHFIFLHINFVCENLFILKSMAHSNRTYSYVCVYSDCVKNAKQWHKCFFACEENVFHLKINFRMGLTLQFHTGFIW